VLYMSMSLDGYIAGPNHPGNPGGDGFNRLHEWYVRSSCPATGRRVPRWRSTRW